MAHCRISLLADPAAGPVYVCTVHLHPVPCRLDGEPAFPAPMHVILDTESRLDAIRWWELRTGRQRPLIIHYSNSPADAGRHNRALDIEPCWCGAEILPAEEG